MTLKEQLKSAKNAIEYQKIVLDTVIHDHYLPNWHLIQIENLKISVLPLLILGSQDEPIPVMASAITQQLIADTLGCLLPTAKVMDEMYKQAKVKISAISHPNWMTDQSMGLPYRLVEQVDYLISAGACKLNPLIFGGWKSWILSNKLTQGSTKAVNHGLYLQHPYQGIQMTPGGVYAIQISGGAHNYAHQDYSQCVVLMSNKCFLDNAQRDTAEILKSPTLSHLLSYEGPLKELRQPGTYSLSDFGL